MFYVKITNEEEDRALDDLFYTFRGKCYICEDKVSVDGETEHRIPKSAGKKYESLISNRFLACGRCNGIKYSNYYRPSNKCQYTDGYCGVIDCTKCDPNKYIGIRIVDDIIMRIEIFEKDYAPCNEDTMSLLREVYGSNEKMETTKLIILKDHIHDAILNLKLLLRKLHFGYIYKLPKVEMKQRKKEVIGYASPDNPFFAIKYTYIEDLCNNSGENGFVEILKEILADPSFHPVVNDCCGQKDSDFV